MNIAISQYSRCVHLEYLEILTYSLLGAILGVLGYILVTKVLRRLFERRVFKPEEDIKSQIKRFQDFKRSEYRFAFRYYRDIVNKWEDTGKTVAGFSGVLLTLIVPITAEFLADIWLAVIMAIASAFCFLLASALSSFYVIFPRAAYWIKCEQAIGYYSHEAQTLDKLVSISFIFFMVGITLLFISLLSFVVIT